MKMRTMMTKPHETRRANIETFASDTAVGSDFRGDAGTTGEQGLRNLQTTVIRRNPNKIGHKEHEITKALDESN
jgi:hypothetical protein